MKVLWCSEKQLKLLNIPKKNMLLSVINKYSANYVQAGKNYMEKYWDETKVFKIEIDHLTGKAHV